MTKRKTKQFEIRSERRILNRALDFFRRIGKGHMRYGWNSGITKATVKEHDDTQRYTD